MRTWSWIVLLLFTTLLGGCPVPPTPETPVSQWYQTNPITKTGYYLYVPNSYRQDRPMPVIVSCHGTPPYDIAEHHIRTWKWYGETHGCIIICPELVGTDGIFGDGPVLGMLENEQRILSILGTLSYKYNLDRNNIMITGFSGGGFPAYWVGLRHPDIFSVIVAQNCNFNRSNTDGWYPPEAVKTPVMIYYGEADPAPIVIQSQNAIEYLRSRGFDVDTAVIPGGHDRHPEVAMNYFKTKWQAPRGSIAPNTPRQNRPERRMNENEIFELLPDPPLP
jgi:predicted esterase